MQYYQPRDSLTFSSALEKLSPSSKVKVRNPELFLFRVQLNMTARGKRRGARKDSTAKKAKVTSESQSNVAVDEFEFQSTEAGKVQGTSSGGRCAPHPSTRFSMECLQSRTRQLLHNSIAVNTASTYKNAVVCFNNFRDQYHLPLVYPSQPSHVVLFIAYCFETGLSPATIKTYIAGLSYHHKINMLHDPTDLFVVKKLLEGCHRSGKRTDSRAPITPSILTSICELLSSICYNVFEATMFKAAYLLTYYGLLRVSEVVHSSCHSLAGHCRFRTSRSRSQVKQSVLPSVSQKHPKLAGLHSCVFHVNPTQTGALFVLYVTMFGLDRVLMVIYSYMLMINL